MAIQPEKTACLFEASLVYILSSCWFVCCLHLLITLVCEREINLTVIVHSFFEEMV